MTKPTMHGTTVWPGGQQIEISTPHREWTTWAARAVVTHEKLVEHLTELLALADSHYPSDDRPSRWPEIHALLARIKEAA